MTTDEASGFATWAESRRRAIDTVLRDRLPVPAPGDDPGRLVEAMRYSLLASGKRLRPLLALAAAEAVGEANPAMSVDPHEDVVLLGAAAVELVHCYSLVHDDLPAMDNDDFRRGKPSNHKAYGEATAILTGDALLTLAFEWLADAGLRSGRPGDFGRAALALARGAGMAGMVRGQARDLGAPPPADLPQLERLHEEKTAALFRAAAELGAAAAGAAPAEIEALGVFGLRFGVAFQHADDRDDDDHAGLAPQARQRVPLLLAEAIAALDDLPSSGPHGQRRGTTLRALAGQLGARAGAPPTDPPDNRR